ncbi:hypothetical protein NECAME_03275 [Necator americanus]|uniref:Uncharacterized protein n=1 Tax=Necator americanus TaxID=51031 RepID=W2T571_NECAM|nr:hypothetical protein NECAME_03275 [Necator americanus]ETN77175.1 hypothetical protein NECAME_03275 [Necator americanus]
MSSRTTTTTTRCILRAINYRRRPDDMDPAQKRKKAVNWCSQENILVISLFLEHYDTYYFKFSDGSKKGVKAVRDALHERWAGQLTQLGFAERSPAQVAEKIKKSIIITRKFINSSGDNAQNGRRDELPCHLKPLEKKLREEYNKIQSDYGFDFGAGEGTMRFYDLLRDIKDESLSSFGGNLEGDEIECLEGDLEIEPSPTDCTENTSRRGITVTSTASHILDSPLVVPVMPFKNQIPAPSAMSRCKKRAAEEDPDEIIEKRHRLLDAELELVERKRYLTEMKIKYWEDKMKQLEPST